MNALFQKLSSQTRFDDERLLDARVGFGSHGSGEADASDRERERGRRQRCKKELGLEAHFRSFQRSALGFQLTALGPAAAEGPRLKADS
jgi:hypothetical protein